MLIRPLLAGVLALAFVQLHAAETVAPAAPEKASPAATPAVKKATAPVEMRDALLRPESKELYRQLAQIPATGGPAIKPTLADVPYGPHPKQVLDFYKAESTKPTALVFYIHGGGWTAGTKARPPLGSFLKNGISVVSVEYRFIQEAMAGGAKPPVEWPLHDAARALQFVRNKAQEWNIDRQRIGATGGSAGACSSLWLAFHDDMADPKSSDPIAHESTRLLCAAVDVAQTSLDPKQLKEWTPNSRYGGHAFGFMVDVATRDKQFDEFLAHREELLPWIKEYSPYEHVTSDDPPVYLFYRDVPAIGQPAKDPTHTSNYGVKLQEKAKSVGVDCELVYPGAPDLKHASIEAYLLEKLK